MASIGNQYNFFCRCATTMQSIRLLFFPLSLSVSVKPIFSWNVWWYQYWWFDSDSFTCSFIVWEFMITFDDFTSLSISTAFPHKTLFTFIIVDVDKVTSADAIEMNPTIHSFRGFHLNFVFSFDFIFMRHSFKFKTLVCQITEAILY